MPGTRRAKCKRNRKQLGGGLGGISTFAPVSGNLINNPLAVGSASSCLAATRPGLLSGVASNGLPGMNGVLGMSGGRRKNRKGSRKTKQRGGSYGFTGASGIVAGFPGAASYTPIQSTGCSAPSSVDVPPSGASDILNRTGGALWDGPPTSALQRGGGYQLGETLKTAAYSQLDGSPGSTFQTGAGTMVSAILPVNGRTSGTCGQTGGKRCYSRKSRKNRKNRKDRKSRKNRKNRKDRKSRKNRK
jgi:hypothetical protein